MVGDQQDVQRVLGVAAGEEHLDGGVAQVVDRELGLPDRRPRARDVRGRSSAGTSLNGATSRRPSSTVAPSASSRGTTRTAQGSSPEVSCAVRGGAKVTVTVPSPSGIRARLSGSTRIQGASGPSGSNR